MDQEPSFNLELPAGWEVRAELDSVAAQTAQGERLAAWAVSIAASNPDASERLDAVQAELRAHGVRELETVSAQLGGEPAIVVGYIYQGAPHVQLSAARHGIEFRISIKATSDEQLSSVLLALAERFRFPSAGAAERARARLRPWLGAQAAALARLQRSRDAAQAAMPRGLEPGRKGSRG